MISWQYYCLVEANCRLRVHSGRVWHPLALGQTGRSKCFANTIAHSNLIRFSRGYWKAISAPTSKTGVVIYNNYLLAVCYYSESCCYFLSVPLGWDQ